jgi:hypothetical protein
LQGELDYLRIQYLSRDQILTEARDIYTRWPELERHDKRTIIEHTLDRVVVGKDDISFELSYVPPSSEIMVTGQRSATRSFLSAISWISRSLNAINFADDSSGSGNFTLLRNTINGC